MGGVLRQVSEPVLRGITTWAPFPACRAASMPPVVWCVARGVNFLLSFHKKDSI